MKIAVFTPHRPQFGNITTQLPLFCALRKEYPEAHIIVFSKSKNSQILVDSGAADELVVYKEFSLFQLIDVLRKGKFSQIYNSYSGSEKVHFSILLSGVKEKYGFSSSKILKRINIYTNHLYFEKGNQYIALNNIDLVNKNFDKNYSTQIIKSLLRTSDIENKSGKEITLIPGGGAGDFKRWSLENYCHTAIYIAKKHHLDRINIIIGPDERDKIDLISEILYGLNYQIYNTPTISKLIDIAERSDLTLSNDCGPCHIFQMMKVPVIMIFGWKFDSNGKLHSSPYGVLREWYYSNDDSWAIFPSEDKKNINSISVDKVSNLALMQLEKDS